MQRSVFSTSVTLLSRGRKKIGCSYRAARTGGRSRAPGMSGGGLGLQHPALGGVCWWKRDEGVEDAAVLPEVNVVLSVAQLSSCGCIYFNKCWRRREKKD